MQAMVLAIQDEIYDYGYEGKYYEIGDNLGTSAHWISRVPVYVDPEMKDGVGHAIYKLMPYGEVFRDFDIGEDGLVGLTGNPQLGFPPTQPSHKTIYMDDDELCKMKHAWLRLTFEVNDSPTPEMRQESAKRQKSRIGFSDWEYRLSNQHDNPNK